MDRLTGGCLCGKVRIVASGAPYRVGICHCLDCRKHHGALFHASAIYPEDAVTIEGETRSLAEPFIVLATQNPIEQEGTYPLPEAQVDRFARAVGLAPMEYLLAWRMAIARDLLRRGETSIADIAERIGYGSASAFSTAFSRAVGQPPGRYARAVDEVADGTAAA